jgi:glycosyltransferase involved in cell wall biosynthesis
MFLNAIATPDTIKNRMSTKILSFKEEPKPLTPESGATPFPNLTRKRVAVIVFSYFPSDPRVYRAASVLAEAGAIVDLFCLRKEGEPKSENLEGIELTRINIKKSRGGKLAYVKEYLAFTAAAFAWLTRRSLKRRYEVVHVHNMPDFLVFSALFAKWRGSRIVLDLHDPMPEVFIAKYGMKENSFPIRLLKWVEKLSIGFADLVLTPNLAFERLFTARNKTKGKVQIIMNSPLEELFPLRSPVSPAKREKEDPFALMYHGTLVERHGLHVALKALAKLEGDFPGLVFFIYGAKTPYLTETVLPLVKELHLEDRVHYLGEQSQTVIAAAIERSDLGIIPNLRSAFTELNFPTRIFEYLALGKPVLVPQTPGISDYFGPENMLFFRWGSEEEEEADLATKIEWVFKHPIEARLLAGRGQEIYRHYLWQAERARFLQLIATLVKLKNG